jgi:hypothetical protein
MLIEFDRCVMEGRSEKDTGTGNAVTSTKACFEIEGASAFCSASKISDGFALAARLQGFVPIGS